MKQLLFGLGLISVMINSASADTVILNETFESYADDSALFGQWGTGDGSNFRLADDSNNAAAFPQGGKGAEHAGGMVAEWIGLNSGNALISVSNSEHCSAGRYV